MDAQGAITEISGCKGKSVPFQSRPFQPHPFQLHHTQLHSPHAVPPLPALPSSPTSASSTHAAPPLPAPPHAAPPLPALPLPIPPLPAPPHAAPPPTSFTHRYCSSTLCFSFRHSLMKSCVLPGATESAIAMEPHPSPATRGPPPPKSCPWAMGFHGCFREESMISLRSSGVRWEALTISLEEIR